MIDTKISCDVCGTDKEKVNHWYAVWTEFSNARFIVQPIDRTPEDAKVFHVCGQTHAMTMFQRWLDGKSLA